MMKLLSASLVRLKKDKTFWFCTLGILCSSLFMMLSVSHSVIDSVNRGYEMCLDDYFFNAITFLGLFLSVFVSLFLGTEYSDGTLRNKVIVGHRRDRIYLSNFITCAVADLVFVAAWLLGSLPGLFLAGPLEMGVQNFLIYLLLILGWTMALTALFTVIGSLSDNKAMTVVLMLFLWLGLLLCASAIYDRLCEPEMQSSAIMTLNGLEVQDPTPNPLYVSGRLRTVLEALLDFLPTGQSILLANNEIVNPLRQLLFSLAFSFLSSFSGIMLFRKKDLI